MEPPGPRRFSTHERLPGERPSSAATVRRSDPGRRRLGGDDGSSRAWQDMLLRRARWRQQRGTGAARRRAMGRLFMAKLPLRYGFSPRRAGRDPRGYANRRAPPAATAMTSSGDVLPGRDGGVEDAQTPQHIAREQRVWSADRRQLPVEHDRGEHGEGGMYDGQAFPDAVDRLEKLGTGTATSRSQDRESSWAEQELSRGPLRIIAKDAAHQAASSRESLASTEPRRT